MIRDRGRAVLRESPVEPNQIMSFAIHCNTPKMVRAVVHEEKVDTFSIDATHFFIAVLVLGPLNDNTKIETNALTPNIGILTRVAAPFLGISHLACPSCGTAVSILRLLDLWDPVDVLVHLGHALKMGVVQMMMPEDVGNMVTHVADLGAIIISSEQIHAYPNSGMIRNEGNGADEHMLGAAWEVEIRLRFMAHEAHMTSILGWI
jgi:hypothetical protein